MIADQVQWRQDDQGNWQYRASDGYWYAAPTPPVAAKESPPAADPRYQTTNRLGGWGILLSILFGGIGGIASVIMGFRSRRQIRSSNGGQRGMGWAVASIIVGSVSIVASVVVVGFLVLVQHGGGGGPSRAQIESSIRPDAAKEGVPGVRHVVCVMPHAWTSGANFTCYAFGITGKQLAQVNGTVLPDQGSQYEWDESWIPT